MSISRSIRTTLGATDRHINVAAATAVFDALAGTTFEQFVALRTLVGGGPGHGGTHGGQAVR